MRPLVPLVTSWQGLTPSRPHSPTPCTHPKPSLPAPTVHAPHSPSVPPGHSPPKSPPLAPAAERRFPGRHRPLPAAPGRCRGRPQLCVGARSPAGGPPAAAPTHPLGAGKGRGEIGVVGGGGWGQGWGRVGSPSLCHPVTLSPRHPIILLPHHPVTSSPRHAVIPPPHRLVTPSLLLPPAAATFPQTPPPPGPSPGVHAGQDPHVLPTSPANPTLLPVTPPSPSSAVVP